MYTRRKTWIVSFICGLLATPAVANNLDVVRAARQQIGVTVIYDGGYQDIEYPGGDVPMERGVCTDVVVRALRRAKSIDLQKLVHEDMRGNFSAYPKNWGLSKPDKNIDHRRVPNLMTFFTRRGKSVSGAFQAGDVVAWRLPGGYYHIGIVADDGRLAIHNIGRGAQKEDILHAFPIIGHYRW